MRIRFVGKRNKAESIPARWYGMRILGTQATSRNFDYSVKTARLQRPDLEKLVCLARSGDPSFHVVIVVVSGIMSNAGALDPRMSTFSWRYCDNTRCCVDLKASVLTQKTPSTSTQHLNVMT